MTASLWWTRRNETKTLRYSGRICGGCGEREPSVQSISGDRGTKKVDRKRPGHVQPSEQQTGTAVTAFQPAIRSRGRSIPGEYSKHHLVYRTEGRTNLVVLFVIVVVVVFVPNGINLYGWDPTRLVFIVFDVSLNLGSGVLVLGRLSVLPMECLMDHSAHCFRSLSLNVIRLESAGKALSDHQRWLRHLTSVLCDAPRTHPPRLSDPTFRAQLIRIRPSLPLTSNDGNWIVLAPVSRNRGPRRGIVAPVSASGNIFSAIAAFLTGAPFTLW